MTQRPTTSKSSSGPPSRAGVIARVKVLSYGDDPEIEPGQGAARAFFDWAGRLEGKQADPQTVHAFCVANGAALDKLGTELPSSIAWVEFRPDNPPGAAAPQGLAYRIVRHGNGRRHRMRRQRNSPPSWPGSGPPICSPWTP